MTLPKYMRVAAMVRAQVADGALTSGMPAPSGAALSRATGYSVLTCRRALRALIADGTLVHGASRNARPRVPGPGGQALADAGRALSTALARYRRAAGLTQPQLAKLTGVSVTNIGHAETGRLWQSRPFWERADEALSAGGELLRLHDAYRAAQTPPGPAPETEDTVPDTDPAQPSATITLDVPGPVACITVTWVDGAVTTVYPPPAHQPGTPEGDLPKQ